MLPFDSIIILSGLVPGKTLVIVYNSLHCRGSRVALDGPVGFIAVIVRHVCHCSKRNYLLIILNYHNMFCYYFVRGSAHNGVLFRYFPTSKSSRYITSAAVLALSFIV